ncbi:transcriptional repressor [Epibacterium ulvae]|uniref:Fur family transcriptional regulator n=1 Tax=Epibacterium ulvae TaxID=1156985 RepID=UPI001BFC5E61|nr:Fur family transcriptional regulator [Epibacterium ulvae]MBT8156100.1 transcriptional repressor [Epibacterium ulvae]
MRSSNFETHDHNQCVKGAIEKVALTCAEKKLQLTPIRRRVLEIMLEEHRAWGAYEILERLGAEGQKSQPPVAYRALDFLVKNRFAHKIERLNAFIACSHPGENHAPIFMICRNCELVAEAHSEPYNGQLGQAARSAGFQIERTIVEAEGLCPKCQ